ncbi:uncharacterized protein BCR38DRAFT_434983 [Pseudomassariella vexata]|uniref:CUE domain-containing protein n=1 Tax=Pseudomassariella vexata TaxID=1141098 RepID=A0A1Y2DYQ3_9PEZI|nr:uncharacterized protein BCR38DRAFT_434983 [Pseudomassariella vexata]ORY64401.1 hypothetical protein BCR38DRAFT_434983 [Pseudomassariella vexata]
MATPTDTTRQSDGNNGPESPTTVRPFEMDDDDVQETGVLGDDGTNTTTITSATSAATTAPAPAAADEAPPTKPARPLTEQQKNEQILKEAFPSIDVPVIKAVLLASGGRIDPAFNALLAMSDPDAVQNEPAPAQEPAPPPQPPRPTGARSPMSQLEADELYARQLAEHYDNAAYEARTTSRGHGGQQPRPRQATGLKPDEMYDREHSFIDDDLPVIKENLRKGFLETQTKVNTWFTTLKKRIDGEYDSEEDESQPSKHQAHRRGGEGSRRSADYERYDADPQVLSDDFAGMRLNPDGTSAPGRSGNPNIYKPPPSSSPRPEGRKVAFKEGHDDIDIYDASPKLPPKDNPASSAPANKQSKWQPMSAVEPSPIAEHDPFSLGDSEDEKDAKDKTGFKETKMEDTERLKQATADAMADSLVDNAAKVDSATKKA